MVTLDHVVLPVPFPGFSPRELESDRQLNCVPLSTVFAGRPTQTKAPDSTTRIIILDVMEIMGLSLASLGRHP